MTASTTIHETPDPSPRALAQAVLDAERLLAELVRNRQALREAAR